MKQILAMPTTECPPSAKIYKCPICQAKLGRKALIVYLYRDHEAERLSYFPFQADRDMLPGQFACNCYFNVFIMDFALFIYFRCSVSPILLYDWIKRDHFGAMFDCAAPSLSAVIQISSISIQFDAVDTQMQLMGYYDE